MTPMKLHFTLERFLVSFLVYQGVLWTMPHSSQAFTPLDDEDYISGKGRAARSSSGSCRFGWSEFGDKCYIVFGNEPLEAKSWFDAKKHCRQMGATLVSIHSKEEQDYLNTMFPRLPLDSGVWIGLHRNQGGRGISWLDGSPLNFRNWHNAIIVRSFKGKTCVEMTVFNDGEWDNELCKVPQRYICQSFKGANKRAVEESSGDGEEPLCTDEFCQNGGSCVDDTTTRNLLCLCANGYKGERCEESILCTDDACKNGGSCVEDAEIGDFQCICMDGFTGERCGEKASVPGFVISEYIYIIGSVIAVISLIIIVVVIVLFKRRKNKNDSVARPAEDKSVTVSFCKRTQSQD